MRRTIVAIFLLLPGSGCSDYRVGMRGSDVADQFKNQIVSKPLAVIPKPSAGWASLRGNFFSVDRLIPYYENEHHVDVRECQIWQRLIDGRPFIHSGIYFDYLYFTKDDLLVGFYRRLVD